MNTINKITVNGKVIELSAPRFANGSKAPSSKIAGHVHDLFWRSQTGVVALVDWTPEGEQQILAGEFDGFSPTAIHKTKANRAELVGIGMNCGALVHKSKERAYGKYFCCVKPTTKFKAMHQLADLFITRLGTRADELKSAESALIHAKEEMQAKWPSLYASYSLRRRLKREFGIEAEFRFPATADEPSKVSTRDFSEFEETPAMTLHGLRAACAPPMIMWAPPGLKFICPLEAKETLCVEYSEADATSLSSQVHAMRAAGKQPFFDFNHELAEL